jgi:HK97 family phage portal protein
LGFATTLVRQVRSLLAPPATPIEGATGGGGRGWYPVVKESFPGAWQSNQEITADTALASTAVYACVSMIAADIGKLELRLMELEAPGVWTETINSAYSPVLREPNRYQLTGPFLEQWITSKLVHGNAYVLKERDARGVVSALYVLDPTKVTPLVTPDGAVYYQLGHNTLTGITGPTTPLVLPASEIIHDPMICLFHPLIGVSPLYACGLSALTGQTILQQSSAFFSNGSNPGGVLTTPKALSKEQLAELKTQWDAAHSAMNQGKVAILEGGLEYKPLAMSAVDAQLIDQLKWSAEQVCATYHVPPYLANVGPAPPYGGIEPVVQQYYNECLQSLMTKLERSLDKGLELASDLGTELAVEDLYYLDTATRTKAAHDTIAGAALSPNEARKRYFALGPVPGGESPYLQQQYYSLAALAARDAAPPSPPSVSPAPPPGDVPPAPDETLAMLTAIRTAALREGIYVA